MKRLQLKIFLSLGVLVLIVIGAVALSSVAGPGSSPLGVALGIGLLAALFLSFAFTRMILEPLEDIRGLSDKLAGGDHDPRLHGYRGDERDAVASSFNRMADRFARELGDSRRETQQLEAVLGEMAEGVLVLDLADRVVLVNPGFRELFDAWGPIRDRSIVEILRYPEIQETMRLARESPAPIVRDVELRGSPDRTLLMHTVRFPSNGPPAGTLAVFHDVTELRRVDRVRRDFVANASHELRTPLTSIQGFAETLASSSSIEHEEMERYLSVILRNVHRMRDLIDDLMDLSRIESERGELDRIRVDVVRLARSLISDMQQRLDRAQIDARLVDESAPDALCDRRALEQILENLLTNAIRYSDQGGRITVEIEPKGELLEIAVSDTGIGIPEVSRDRIFERFYRVDAARSRALGSTGLGLSIVRHLVQQMGGTIRVESEVGVGSRFVFTVPRAPEETPPLETPSDGATR